MSATDQRIRELAYQIWQSEGCPHGEDDRHWQMACRLAEAEQRSPEATPTATSPLPADRLDDDPPASDSSLLAEASDPAMTPPSDPAAKPSTPRTKASAAAPKAATAAEAGTPATIKKPRTPRKKKET